MKRLRLFSLATVAVFALVFMVSPALAALVWVEDSTKTKGATTITWDSSFQDLDYTLSDTITMTVNWTVDAGAAGYDDFALKDKNPFTPKSRRDPAGGYVISTSQSGTSVTIEFRFDKLHLDKKRNVEIGNAHFKLYLDIDKDGDGMVDSTAGYGVNVHVEDPQ